MNLKLDGTAWMAGKGIVYMIVRVLAHICSSGHCVKVLSSSPCVGHEGPVYPQASHRRAPCGSLPSLNVGINKI